MVELATLLGDLDAESTDVDLRVAGLTDDEWRLPTPATGWTIAHQIAHLAWSDNASLLACTDPDHFNEQLAAALAAPTTFVDRGADEFLDSPTALLARWRTGRNTLTHALRDAPAGHRIPWYATTMSPASMATARIMETWAHGLDIADALRLSPAPTHRLQHIVFLGYRTLGFSFLARERPVPTEPIHLRLDAPDGTHWQLGPPDATNIVTGTALDFCLLVTQRRHRDDLALHASGPIANEWLDIAQAFAGPPGSGREPGQVPA